MGPSWVHHGLLIGPILGPIWAPTWVLGPSWAQVGPNLGPSWVTTLSLHCCRSCPCPRHSARRSCSDSGPRSTPCPRKLPPLPRPQRAPRKSPLVQQRTGRSGMIFLALSRAHVQGNAKSSPKVPQTLKRTGFGRVPQKLETSCKGVGPFCNLCLNLFWNSSKPVLFDVCGTFGELLAFS